MDPGALPALKAIRTERGEPGDDDRDSLPVLVWFVPERAPGPVSAFCGTERVGTVDDEEFCQLVRRWYDKRHPYACHIAGHLIGTDSIHVSYRRTATES